MQKICKLTCSKATLAALLLGLLLTMFFALPAEAVAFESNTLIVAGVRLFDGQCLTNNNATTATPGDNNGNYVAYYKNNVLYLNGLVITLNENYNVGNEPVKNIIMGYGYNQDLTIELSGDNVLTQENGNAAISISGNNSIVIKGKGNGNGSLTINTNENGIWTHGALTISDGAEVIVTCNKSGITCESSLTVSNSTLDLTGGDHAVWLHGVLNIDENAIVTAKGTTKSAFNKAPARIDYETIKVLASANIDGDDLVVYKNEDNENYHYVKVQAKTFVLTFNTDGGSAIEPIVASAGKSINAPADPTKEGYTFTGWSSAIPETMPAQNMTITAQWAVNQYTITFDTDGGSEIADITQDYGTAITAPKDPTKDGFIFDGWDQEIPETMPAQNMTIKASWKDNSGEGDASESLIDIIVSTSPQSVTFNGSKQEFDIISEPPTGGFSVKYKQGGEEVTPINVGTYDVVISRAEDATYSAYNATVADGLIITKADYDFTSSPYPQASRVSVGSKLSASVLSPANVKVAGNVIGTFAWVTPNEVLNEKGTFNKEVKFTITDTQNYNEQTVTFTIPVQVYRESYSGGGGDYYTPSDTVTSTTQNSDGSVTETTVDKTTGTTTTVTTKPDGAKVTVEEKKDGSVTTIEETTIGKVTTDTDGKGNIKSEVELKFDRATDINLPIRDYSDIAKLTVTYEDGTKVDIIDFKKTADGIKINVADDCSVAFNKVVPHNFTDLASDHWATKDIDYISSTGLMRGMTATNFEPNVTLTRGMLVTILYRLENEPAVNTNMGFIDVDLAQYYAKAVAWAKANGIVNGVSEDRFAPDSQITREQMAAIMCNYAEHKGYDISVGENTNILSYDDFSNISEYAIASMQYAAGSGLFKGRTPSTINPQDTATRAETAAILHRFVENNR